jgi:phthalate 4,5-cis-dihydrodiol dehydrogenase
MRELIASSEVGRLSMIAMANYTDFIYRPRRPEELDTSLGGGILFNQIPHQVDIARLLSGSKVRQVRATTGILDLNRPTEGSCMAMLSFEDGAAASLIYSGYDRFDSDELHGWIGESGGPKNPITVQPAGSRWHRQWCRGGAASLREVWLRRSALAAGTGRALASAAF